MDKIYKEGKESFPAWWIILENLAFVVNWGLAFVLLMPFRYIGIPVVSLMYLIVLITIQIILKKHNCTNCYYYGKWCHLGWGKLTALIFKKNSGNQEFGMKLAISYILQLPVIAVLAILAGFLYGFTLGNLLLLIIFIIINIVHGTVIRKKGCENCKAKYTCPGCAVKK